MRMDGTSCTVNHDLISKLTFQPTKNPVEEVLWRLLEISGSPSHLSYPFLLSKNEMTIDGNSCAVSGNLGLRRTFALKPKPSILRRDFWKEKQQQKQQQLISLVKYFNWRITLIDINKEDIQLWWAKFFYHPDVSCRVINSQDKRQHSHCQQQQSYSGLRSPGRSNSNYL